MASEHNTIDDDAQISSLSSLNYVSVDGWRTWLDRGIKIWSRSKVGDAQRIAAFSPFAMDHNDRDGPGQLVALLEKIRLSPAAEARLSKAIANSLETCTPSDEIQFIVFLLRLAGHVSWPVSPEPHIRVLLSHEFYVAEEERTLLARAVAFAAIQRLTVEEVHRIAQLLQRRHLNKPDALIEMVAKIAAAYPTTLINNIRALLPEMRSMPHDDPVMKVFSDLLVDRVGMECVLREAYSDFSADYIFLQDVLKHRLTSDGTGRFRDKYTDEIATVPSAIGTTPSWNRIKDFFHRMEVDDRVFQSRRQSGAQALG